MNKIATVPNFISISRIPLAGLLLWQTIELNLRAAAIILIVGCFTDMLDGYLARKLDQQSDFGQNILEPACDFILASAAALGLIISGIWPIVTGAILVLIAASLQLISMMAGRNQFWGHLKRHQHWIHPSYFVIVMMIVLVEYVWQLSSHRPTQVGLFILLLLVIAMTVYARRDWLNRLWTEGQQWPRQTTT